MSIRFDVRGVVTDIEGTTTPIAFVHRVLFPFARARLPAYVAEHADDPEIAEALAAVRAEASGTDPVTTLLAWLDADRKATPLKTIQGLIWRDGYRAGSLSSQLYPDVAPALRRWAESGLVLAVYSSGSAEAQRLIFGHAPEGDLTSLFAGFFDTRVGPKRAAASYAAIANALALQPAALLFLSDVEPELDAADAAGWQTCHVVRPSDGTVAGGRHATVSDLASLDLAPT